jgi:hypothetical protein
MGGIYEVAVEMGVGAMIYIPSFIKFGLGIQKLIRMIHRQHGDHMSLPIFSQNKESRLKITVIDTSKEVGVEADIEKTKCMLIS